MTVSDPLRPPIAALRSRALLPLAALSVLCALACGPRELQKPNVLLLVVDALRADHLGSYNPAVDFTPHIDRFADASVVFVDAVAQAPNTINSTPSILTSVYVSEHGYTNYKLAISPRHLTAAEILNQRGYETYAVSTNPHVTARNGLAQGFDEFIDNPTWIHTDAHVVNRIFFDWVDRRTEKRPFFAMLWYIDPHVPYDPPASHTARFVPPALRRLVTPRTQRPGFKELSDEEKLVSRKLYQGEVSYFDDQLGELVEELRRRDLFEDTLILLTSDHGESFWERRGVDGRPVIGHGISLYPEEIQVPWLIKLPRSSQVGRFELRVNSIDILPTLLEAAAVEDADGLARRMRGKSLMPFLRGDVAPVAERSVSELVTDFRGSLDIKLRSVETDAGKLILTYMYRGQQFDPPRAQLFGPAGEELADDPSDATAVELKRALLAELEDWEAKLQPLAPERAQQASDEEELRKRLEALGYVN